MFKALRKLGGAAMGASRVLNKIPGASLLKGVPGLGTALTIAGGAASLSSMMGGSKSSNLPSLASFASTGMPALPGMGAPPVVGNRGIFQNDPNIVAALQPFAISKANLRMSYRSPLKGYVIRYDSKGDPYAIPKSMARAYLGWKPAKKPPLSVGDWQAIQRADRATKKVRRIMATVTRVDKAVSGGKVKIRQGGKKK